MQAKSDGCWKGDLRHKNNFLHWFSDVEEMNHHIADADFSMTVSDPSQHDHPLIGCSSGFSKLTGYSAEDILGSNCRFLIDRVPEEHRDASERKKAREFSQACQKVSMASTSEPGPADCCCLQVNCRKDGTLFRNMFHMHFTRIDGKAYVVALQNEVNWQLHISSALYLHISNRYKMILDTTYRGCSVLSSFNMPETTFQHELAGLNRWLVQSLRIYGGWVEEGEEEEEDLASTTQQISKFNSAMTGTRKDFSSFKISL